MTNFDLDVTDDEQRQVVRDSDWKGLPQAGIRRVETGASGGRCGGKLS